MSEAAEPTAPVEAGAICDLHSAAALGVASVLEAAAPAEATGQSKEG